MYANIDAQINSRSETDYKQAAYRSNMIAWQQVSAT